MPVTIATDSAFFATLCRNPAPRVYVSSQNVSFLSAVRAHQTHAKCNARSGAERETRAEATVESPGVHEPRIPCHDAPNLHLVAKSTQRDAQLAVPEFALG